MESSLDAYFQPAVLLKRTGKENPKSTCIKVVNGLKSSDVSVHLGRHFYKINTLPEVAATILVTRSLVNYLDPLDH